MVSRLTKTGSSHALYLGASARIARLQVEHLRLSINAMALRSSIHSDGHESSVTYLCKALTAAKGTIQTHFESSQTDLALSFATDVSLRSESHSGFNDCSTLIVANDHCRASPAGRHATTLPGLA